MATTTHDRFIDSSIGKIGTGILMIVTIGGCFGIWVLIDLIMILALECPRESSFGSSAT